MSDKEQVRKMVSEAYARAISGGGSCCVPATESSCCGPGVDAEPIQKGVAAKLAGYSQAELDLLPADAVINSFGCGNPLAYSGVRPGDVVLDLGAGAGIDILIAAQKVGPTGRAIGIDMTAEMIAKARENIANSGLDNAEVRMGIIEELPVESSSVDWVSSNCVINLSPEKDRVFAEIARVLKPGGQMLVSDIVAEDLPPVVLENATLYSSCIAGAISEADYLQGLRDAGLETVEVKERLVYDAAQLASLVETELPEGQLDCCSGGLPKELIAQLAGEVSGKIWSAKVFARKPTV